MFTAFSSCLGHDRQTFARADDRLVALVYGITAKFRYNEQKVLVFGKEQGYIPTGIQRSCKLRIREGVRDEFTLIYPFSLDKAQGLPTIVAIPAPLH